MPSVLVSGFEPFGGDTRNPSALVALALSGRRIEGHLVTGVVLPCVFGQARGELLSHVKRLGPDLVICLGEAGGRAAISLERIAINLEDARIADNAGAQPREQLIEPRGPAAYFSTLPLAAIAQALAQESLPVETSLSAGTFVCNHVFYGLMHDLSHQPQVRAGFIHVPYLPEQALPKGGSTPYLELERITRAVELAVVVSLRASVSNARA